MDFVNGKAVSGHSRRMLLLLDEFAALGPLEVISETIAYMASFGIKAMLVVQDYSQLWSLYTRDEKLSGNCHLQVAFAPNRVDTAEKLSAMTGTTTVVKQEKLHQTTISLMAPHDDRFSEVSRPLMTADEIMRMAPAKKASDDILEAGEMLIFVGGSHPVKGVQPLYFIDPILSKRAQLPAPKPLPLMAASKRLFEPGARSTMLMQLILNAPPNGAKTSTLEAEPSSVAQDTLANPFELLDDPESAGVNGDSELYDGAGDGENGSEFFPIEADAIARDVSSIDAGRGAGR